MTMGLWAKLPPQARGRLLPSFFSFKKFVEDLWPRMCSKRNNVHIRGVEVDEDKVWSGSI